MHLDICKRIFVYKKKKDWILYEPLEQFYLLAGQLYIWKPIIQENAFFILTEKCVSYVWFVSLFIMSPSKSI